MFPPWGNERFRKLFKGKRNCGQEKQQASVQRSETLKLDIHKRTVPHHLERFTPFGALHTRQFRFSAHPFRWAVHGGSMQTPLQPPRATVSIPLPAFPVPLPRESLILLLPFCCFRFCERASLPLTLDRISVL
ncbi:hypothetical protein AVEN_241683-1 [Araneus ventricosus]|uniref:Uncharacterized protein n=1 Tax=Araneus ventricosus TaxID=182803 RepID=A0A4Y2HFD0_ARAVE|nr:hypothetical protein AVEN_241683-1 [Araneus ventricosus]